MKVRQGAKGAKIAEGKPNFYYPQGPATMIKNFKIYHIHPFLFALAPAIFLWSDYFSGPLPHGVPFVLIATAMFAGFIFMISLLFWRSFDKAALSASVFLLFIFSHSYIYEPVFGRIFASRALLHFVGILSSLIIIAASVFFIKKTKKNLAVANKIFTVISGAFLLISFAQIGFNYQLVSNHETGYQIEVGLADVAEFPDVYYIILDAHLSSEVLEALGYEEINEFVLFLEERGFFLPKQSQSNYPTSTLSLSSSLNMRYLEEAEMENFALKRHMIEDHFLKDFFQDYGYNYLHFGTIWHTYKNRYADKNITANPYSHYQSGFWRLTAFHPVGAFIVRNFLGADTFDLVSPKLSFLDSRVQSVQDTQLKLQELVQVPEREGFNFTFAHLLIPHEPYVFDTSGNFLSAKEEVERTKVENYLGMVEYIDKEMMTLIDEILEKSDPKPIIIIQGDHGDRFPEGPDLRYQILNAYYFPDGGDELLYDDITPVNSFRVLLNYYFDQEFELLEDKIIFNEW